MRAAPNTEQHLRSFAARAERGSPPHPSKLRSYDIAATAARRFIASGARLGEHTPPKHPEHTVLPRARRGGQPRRVCRRNQTARAGATRAASRGAPSMGLADVIQPATSTAYDDEDDYGMWATLACILAGAVFTFLCLAGGQERQEQTQSVRDAEDDDARTNLLRACTRVLSWEADSDDEQESRAFATALDDALKRARSVHDGLSTMPTPPSVNTWAQSELQLLAERDLEGSSAGLELGATALALATTRRDHWEACETIGDEGRAAAFVVAASENVHTSVLLLGTRCRPRMPCAGERGLLVVAAGALADENGTQHKPGSCLAFRQSATRVLRADAGPVLCVLLRVPVSCEMLLLDVS